MSQDVLLWRDKETFSPANNAWEARIHPRQEHGSWLGAEGGVGVAEELPRGVAQTAVSQESLIKTKFLI